jgi:hypothetical protein
MRTRNFASHDLSLVGAYVISYVVDKQPTENPIPQAKVRPRELPDSPPNLTTSRAAFKTLFSVELETTMWTPTAASITCLYFFFVSFVHIAARNSNDKIFLAGKRNRH